jgi:hypothetical protein
LALSLATLEFTLRGRSCLRQWRLRSPSLLTSKCRRGFRTLNELIADLADNKLEEAAKIVEQKLGMSSLGLHGAAHMAPFMPKPMQDIGTTMHRAASRLVIVQQNASVSPSLETMREINLSLHEVTSACTGCHASYRIR